VNGQTSSGKKRKTSTKKKKPKALLATWSGKKSATTLLSKRWGKGQEKTETALSTLRGRGVMVEDGQSPTGGFRLNRKGEGQKGKKLQLPHKLTKRGKGGFRFF